MKIYDWNKISEAKKSEVGSQKPVFICGSIDLSEERILQIYKTFAGKANIVWGILKDEFIPGLEDSPQFKTLKQSKLVKTLTDQPPLFSPANHSKETSVLKYFQRDWKYILKDLDFSAVILLNGSWYKAIHQREELWILMNKGTKYKFVSPFTGEKEAKEFVQQNLDSLKKTVQFNAEKNYTDTQLMKLANDSGKQSFDWTFQTGCCIALNGKPLLTIYNKIIPYDSYSMHFGSLREKNFSPLGDLNNYDTVHAEVEIILEALKKGININESTLYINLLPCPNCAKMIADSPISEVVYSLDHSDGFAVKLLESSGKKVRRLV